MKNSLLSFFLSITIFCTVCVWAYAKVETTAEEGIILRNSKQAEETTKKTVNIAIVLPLTGNNRGSGKRLEMALPLIEDLNENFQYDNEFGRDYNFETFLYDDSCDTEKAKTVAKHIIAKKNIHFVIGHYCSAATLEAAKLYKDNGIIQIAPFSTATDLTEQGFEHFFRLAGRNDYQAMVAAKLLIDLSLNRKISVIGYEGYGQELASHVRNRLRGAGKTISLRIDIKNNPDGSQKTLYYDNNIEDNNDIDFEKIVESLIQKNITLVYYGGYYTDLAKILKIIQRRQKEILDKLGRKILFISGDSVQNREFWEQAGIGTEGVIFTLTKDYTRDIPDRELSAILTEKRKKQAIKDGNKELLKLTSELKFNTKSYKDRKRFLRKHFEKYGFFADLYAVNIYIAYQIIKNIVIDQDGNAGLPDAKIVTDGIVKNFPRYRTPQEWVSKISKIIKSKGSNLNSNVVGFETIIGGVNFDEAGNWSNPEYVIYRWVGKKEDRSWLDDDDTGKFIGKMGDFVRIF